VAPFEEFVGDACGSRGGFVGRARKVARDLFFRDGRKFARGKRGRVRGVRIRDRLRDDREESIRQDLTEVGVGCSESPVEFKEGWDLVDASPVTPCCGLPQSVAGNSGEIVI